MTQLVYLLIGFASGVLAARIWQKYLEEDLTLMRIEAQHIIDRLDKVLTELRQRNAAIVVGDKAS